MPGKADDAGLSAWATDTHMGDQNGVPGSWLQVGLALTVVAIRRVS